MKDGEFIDQLSDNVCQNEPCSLELMRGTFILILVSLPETNG
jgi:hypothetical protein